MTFKALHTGRLSDLFQYHEPTRSLRSSSSHQLSVPRHNLTFGSRAFRFSAPRVRNPLPVSIRETKSLPTFRRHLKTHYFAGLIMFNSRRLKAPKRGRAPTKLSLDCAKSSFFFFFKPKSKPLFPLSAVHCTQYLIRPISL